MKFTLILLSLLSISLFSQSYVCESNKYKLTIEKARKFYVFNLEDKVILEKYKEQFADRPEMLKLILKSYKGETRNVLNEGCSLMNNCDIQFEGNQLTFFCERAKKKAVKTLSFSSNPSDEVILRCQYKASGTLGESDYNFGDIRDLNCTKK